MTIDRRTFLGASAAGAAGKAVASKSGSSVGAADPATARNPAAPGGSPSTSSAIGKPISGAPERTSRGVPEAPTVPGPSEVASPPGPPTAPRARRAVERPRKRGARRRANQSTNFTFLHLDDEIESGVHRQGRIRWQDKRGLVFFNDCRAFDNCTGW